jgi:hypothetical protein
MKNKIKIHEVDEKSNFKGVQKLQFSVDLSFSSSYGWIHFPPKIIK